MICYILIMNMPLWITVYLRNKWCLNLESWILILYKETAKMAISEDVPKASIVDRFWRKHGKKEV